MFFCGFFGCGWGGGGKIGVADDGNGLSKIIFQLDVMKFIVITLSIFVSNLFLIRRRIFLPSSIFESYAFWVAVCSYMSPDQYILMKEI